MGLLLRGVVEEVGRVKGGALGHAQRGEDQVPRHPVDVLQTQELHPDVLLVRPATTIPLRGRSISGGRELSCGAGHEVGDAEAELLLDDFVPEGELLLEVLDVVVPLLDVELRPVLLPLEVDLLQIQQVLVVLDINLFDLLLEELLLVLLEEAGALGL